MAVKLPVHFFHKTDYNSHSAFRKAVEIYLKKFLKDKTVANIDTGIVIQFYKIGIEKMVSSIGDIKACALYNLQLVLEHAQFINAETDKLNRPDILRVLLFITNVEIKEEEYEVWSYVKERPTGYFLYSIHIDIKKAL